jgi:hypothetical protein
VGIMTEIIALPKSGGKQQNFLSCAPARDFILALPPAERQHSLPQIFRSGREISSHF